MVVNGQPSPEIQKVLDVWQPYVDSIDDWQVIVGDIKPVATGCGPVYEVPNPLDRSNESFAIADMRSIEYAQPHFHANDETEIYFVLQGRGQVVVGYEVLSVEKGNTVVTPSGTAHYTIPNQKEGLVLAVVNTPPFNPENNIDLTKSNPDVQFDYEQFQQLISGR